MVEMPRVKKPEQSQQQKQQRKDVTIWETFRYNRENKFYKTVRLHETESGVFLSFYWGYKEGEGDSIHIKLEESELAQMLIKLLRYLMK